MPCGSKSAIEALRRDMGIDVLVTGHSHKLDIWQGRDGGLYVNPGSVCGLHNTLMSGKG